MFDAEKVKQRITIMLCVNALGEKEAPLIVNNSLQPKCFKNLCMSELGVEWYANQKSWMTGSIFIDWIENFNSKMKKQNRKVLLILDNAPCHPKISLSNVILLFLPSKSQPLNLGIIKLFKLQYQRRLLTSVFALMNSMENVNEMIKQITLADAVEYVKEAWSCVNENTIKNSFKKSVINCKLPEDIHAEEIIVQTENEVIALSQQLGIDIKTNFEEEEFHVEDDWEEDSLEMQAIASSSKEVLIK
ncbi:Tigger transposable element-derived protein 6, partial [Stegodyphus mimosarum]